jgi:4-amino-4-deoxychorismate lyase
VLKSFGIKDFKDLSKYLHPPKDGIFRCRVIYDIKNLDYLNTTYHEYQKRKITSLKIIYNDEIDYSKKSLNREVIDKLYKQKEDCDDILIVKDSFLTDTSIANIALYKDGVWFSPKTPLLAGTTRERFLENKKIVLKDIRVDELKDYSKVALLNSMIDFDIISDISFKTTKDNSC